MTIKYFPNQIKQLWNKREEEFICQVMDCFCHSDSCLMISGHKSLAVRIPERYSRQIYVHRHPKSILVLLLLLLFGDLFFFGI